MIEYLSVDEILRLHYKVVEDYGGSHGVRDEGRLAAVISAVQQEAFGKQLYPNAVTKAAVYLHNIVLDHPFIDGNKRTALTACGIFLLRNGMKLSVDPKELEDFVVEIITEHHTIEVVANWLKLHTSR